MIDKMIVAPQIVVYKNLLKNSDNLISIIEQKDKANSIWPDWKPWYEQGENINQLFFRDDFMSEDSFEKKYLKIL